MGSAVEKTYRQERVGKGNMKRREKLTGEQRVALALDLIKGESTLAQVCARYNVSHTTAYNIRNAFLRGGREAVMGRRTRMMEALWDRVARLERALGTQPPQGASDGGKEGAEDLPPRLVGAIVYGARIVGYQELRRYLPMVRSRVFMSLARVLGSGPGGWAQWQSRGAAPGSWDRLRAMDPVAGRPGVGRWLGGWISCSGGQL